MAYLGEEIKKLGFGLMRPPMKGDVIDLEQTKAMVDRFWKQALPILIRRGPMKALKKP